jgi:hypothetical protein
MNREDIIRMARESGMPETATEGVFIANSDDLGRLIAAEREACAKVCENEIEKVKPAYSVTAENALKAIRARGNSEVS